MQSPAQEEEEEQEIVKEGESYFPSWFKTRDKIFVSSKI